MARGLNDEGVGPAEVAGAYLRIADIYRRGRLPGLAVDYYRLVIRRFAGVPRAAVRARLRAARILAAGKSRREARRLLRPVLRGEHTAAGARAAAALLLLHTYAAEGRRKRWRQTRRVVARRLALHFPPRRVARILQRAAPPPAPRRRRQA